MSGYLGYDPARVRVLRDALGALDLERRALVTDDPLVAGVLARYQRAAQGVAAHGPRLDAVLALAAAEDALHLPGGFVLSRGGTWPVVADPTPGTAPPPLEATLAAAVAALRREGAGAARQWPALTQALGAVAGDRAAAARLVRAVGRERLAARCAELADELRTPEGDPAAADLLVAIGWVVGAAPHPERLVPRLDPIAAAVVVGGGAHTGWRGPALAEAAAAALAGLAGLDPLTVGRHERQVAHDVLLGGLARDPEAVRLLLDQVPDAVLSHLLTTPWRDAARLGQVLAGALDPATAPAAEAAPLAGRVLLLLHEGRARIAATPPPPAAAPVDPLDPSWSFLAEPPAQLPEGTGWVAGGWAEPLLDRFGPDRGMAEVLVWLAAFPAARAELSAAAIASFAGAARDTADPARLADAAYAAAAVHDAIDHQRVAARTTDAEQRAAWLDVAEALAGTTPIGAAVVTGVALGDALTGGEPLVERLVPEDRRPTAPADLAAHLLAGADARVVAFQWLAAAGVVARRGGSPPPPLPALDPDAVDAGDRADRASAAWEPRYRRWLAGLASPVAAEVARAVAEVGSAARAAAGAVA